VPAKPAANSTFLADRSNQTAVSAQPNAFIRRSLNPSRPKTVFAIGLEPMVPSMAHPGTNGWINISSKPSRRHSTSPRNGSKQRTRLRNRGHVQTSAVLKRRTKAGLALVERQIAERNAEIAKHIAEDKAMARKPEIMCSVRRLGLIASAPILTFLPEIGTPDRKQSGSLAGPVPHRRESGQWKGKSFFSGGRKPLRDALYMPALVAMRFNPDLKAKYNALRQAGKPAELAIVAIMRKLLETANAPVKADRLQAPKCP